ncbi:type IV secretion system DNA-binding domain-containing protein [Holosporaceae bacterium 'Namur']|nr:type IV secretion system DNA-binding domain-containing protein [Holosporaceae bacterium 'Namur']
MSNLVRGGQITFHSLRMLVQLMKPLTRWVIIMWVILTLGLLAIRMHPTQFEYTSAYFKAQFYSAIKAQEEPVSMGNKKIKAKHILRSSLAKYHTDKTIEMAKESGFIILVVVMLCWTALIVYFVMKGYKLKQSSFIRGREVVSAKELKRIIQSHNKSQKYKAYSLGSIPYPAYTETMHTLITGSTGSGKTILISDLINQIKARGDRAIIFDKMGYYTERFFDETQDVLLNPFDKRSPTWSIFKEVKQAANFDSIAAAFIPIEKSTSDPFWIKAARTIFTEVCSSLHSKGGVSNEELVNTLLKKNLNEAAQLVKGTAAQAIIDEQSPKTALSVMSVLSTYLKCLTFLKDENEIFSIKDWVLDHDRKGCVFISSTGQLHTALMPLISAWIEIAINNILSLQSSRERKIWIILDELPSLHTLPSLVQGLAEVRQFGGCFVLSIQSVSQLKDSYGYNGAQTISSLCNSKVFLRAGDSDSAK